MEMGGDFPIWNRVPTSTFSLDLKPAMPIT
jgi:hypothetical protein